LVRQLCPEAAQTLQALAPVLYELGVLLDALGGLLLQEELGIVIGADVVGSSANEGAVL
jgi:hypothetical protein